MSDGGKYSFPSPEVFTEKRKYLFSHQEGTQGKIWRSHHFSHHSMNHLSPSSSATSNTYLIFLRLSCLGWNWSESWSELGENSWREWVFIYWLHQSKDTGELLSACFSLLHHLRKNGSEHIFKWIGRKQLLERKSFQLQEPELTRATRCLRRRRHREKIHRGPRAFPHLPWEEKHPAHRGRQVFLLASRNLEGLKVSKARNTKNCGTDYRIIGDAHNYGKKRLVGAVEACGPARAAGNERGWG